MILIHILDDGVQAGGRGLASGTGPRGIMSPEVFLVGCRKTLEGQIPAIKPRNVSVSALDHSQ